ncbi:MAG TPA: hypothetical protein VEQ17_03445 [Steroidobacteraceae bacterium]|nr:hypothetical protein [Steroidobacteraceae bacterium]
MIFDSLAALLLLSGTLLGAGLVLVQSLAGSRAATLQTSAVDLAADLTESLYAAVDPTRVIADWRLQVPRKLPAGAAAADVDEAQAGASTSMLDIVVGWRDQGGQPLRLELPFAMSAPAGLP